MELNLGASSLKYLAAALLKRHHQRLRLGLRSQSRPKDHPKNRRKKKKRKNLRKNNLLNSSSNSNNQWMEWKIKPKFLFEMIILTNKQK